MARVHGPLAPRRAIGEMLRSARSNKGLEEVARACMISTSKLSRIENGQGVPTARDIRDLSVYFEFSEDQRSKLHRLVAAASRKGWWDKYEEYLEEDLDAHASYESDADEERAYTIPVLPALLQTRDYAQSLIWSYNRSLEGEPLRQLVEFRMRRQDLLKERAGRDPLHLHAITHESSLHQLVGDPRTMHAQMERLIDVVKTDDNVTFSILPFESLPRFTHGCMYAIFSFSDIPNIVHVENHDWKRFVTQEAETLAYRDYFDALVRDSLSNTKTVATLEAARDMWAAKAVR